MPSKKLRCFVFELRLSFRLFVARFVLIRFLRGFASSSILELIRSPPILVNADGDIAENTIVDTHAALEFGNLAARSFGFEQDVNAFFLMLDLISKLTPAHHFGLGHGAV